MYLKRLEISGFKSFANKTILDFLPGIDSADDVARGITAIVGPNGSGKSNVADAIRWAIGEQSLKNLRGKKSEDVIFAGTDKKSRLGSASVTLFFDNSDKRLPIEFTEVSIARKIYRSGESEYLINSMKVRLIDVVDLLAKAGIGKDSYCVITQGMSDSVLNATPLERRSILEDAAGVKQYQIRKDRALRKLESTADNLIRVDSLLVEIEPHLKNLRRQAEKAAQGKEVVEKLRAKQLLLYGFLWHSFDSERRAFREEEKQALDRLVLAEDEASRINEEVLAVSARFEDTRGEDQLEAEISVLQRELNGEERELAVIDGRIEVELERRKPREVTESIPVDLAYVRARLDEVRAAQDKLIDRLTHVEDLSELQELRELALVIKTRLHELETDAGKGVVVRKQVVTLPDAELAISDATIAELTVRKESLSRSNTVKKNRLATAERELTEERRKTRESRERFFDLERAARARQAELGGLKDTLNATRVKLARVEVREEDLRNAVRQELSMDASELAPVTDMIETDRLEREILRLKVQMEHIGSIDPLVLDEFKQTEERYEFLGRESADLRAAMESLRAIIAEMDERINATFDTAFDIINAEFQKHFALIFGGGRAELKAVSIRPRTGIEDELPEDGTAPDDTEDRPEKRLLRGIEIAACPPGKKITNLSMLSGGERSLTSLALLFAIIAYNPPPFAVLDEVEAALDEANSRRFSRVLQEFAQHTQFVAITHNRETMRQASLLYGVTMGEDGVSKLLSVHLDQIGQLAGQSKKI